uniref:VHS domain-containing protein n=1 Tax=Candidozyma auris TaxID=498019 RepID=A0A0L0NTV3_CANAR
MPIFGDKPHTSITVKVNQLSKPNRNEDLEDDSIELYLSDLISLIKLQPGPGPSEAARAIRKNIKYGATVQTQLNALQLLELLVLNAGPKIGPVLASDEKLLDVLKGIITGSGSTGTGAKYDRAVQQKARNLAVGWKLELAGLDGYKYMANLWKVAGGRRRMLDSRGSGGAHRGHRRTTSAFGDENALDEPEDLIDRDDEPRASSPRNHTVSPPRPAKKSPPPRPVTASPYSSTNHKNDTSSTRKQSKLKKKKKKRSRFGIVYADEQYRIPQINYKVEAPKIRAVLSDCQTHTAALNNALLHIPAGTDPLDDEKAAREFEKCRKVRRKVLQYLQFVGAGEEASKSKETLEMEEEFLGSLIMANEQLVNTFTQFDKAAGYTAENPGPHHHDAASDSDSDESYYSSDSEEEEEEEGVKDSIEQRLESAHILEGTSSRLQEAVKRPPPVPPSSKPTSKELGSELEPLHKVSTDATGASVVSEDPFGDSHEVSSTYAR